MKKHIPNTITLINLFCGGCAIVCVMYGSFVMAFWFLFTGGVMDYLDGAVARILDVHSPLGKELDSMADMVSFGVAPGMILYTLLSIAWTKESGDFSTGGFDFGIYPLAFPAFILSAFSGLRLAKFNLDTRQSENFIGLNTPACTIFMTGLMLIYHYDSLGLGDFVTQVYFLYAVIAVFSYLLVAELPMFSFKFKNFTWKDNWVRFSFLILMVVLLITLQEAAFSIVILLYVIVATVQYLLGQTKI